MSTANRTNILMRGAAQFVHLKLAPRPCSGPLGLRERVRAGPGGGRGVSALPRPNRIERNRTGSLS